jgi:hypothetical protein
MNYSVAAINGTLCQVIFSKPQIHQQNRKSIPESHSKHDVYDIIS